MRRYAKIKGSNSFSQNSKVKKEYPFLDVDFDHDKALDVYSSKTQENEQKPNIVKDDKKKKKNEYFLENYSKEHEDEEVKKEGERNVEGVLRRNNTISSSTTLSLLAYQKNGKSENLDRQSSTKSIQKVVKRAFSTGRSSSVNSNRYCRIYDQPKNVRGFDNNESLNQHVHDVDDDEYESESINGSMERSYMSMKKNKNDYETNNMNNNGRVKVGSKVAKACKRLFSR